THTVLTGVGQDRQTDFFQCFPQRVELAIRWVKPLDRWVEFESTDTELSGLTLGLFDRGFTVAWINRAEGQQHVVIALCTGDQIVDRVWQVTVELGASIQRK